MKSKLRNIFERLILFLIAIPLIFAAVLFFPQKEHLLLNIIVIILCTLGALEFSSMLKKKNMHLHGIEAALFGLLPPFSAMLYISLNWTPYIIPLAVLVCVAYSLISCALTAGKELEESGSRLAGAFAVLFYPGMCFGTLIFMNKASHSTALILTFLCMVFLNDAAAWLFGMLFGRGNNGIFAASPNKSIVGFIAGILATVGVGIIAANWLPYVFTAARFSAIASGVILGCTTGVAAILGDLAESAIKRSSGVKDSGSIIPGRGGVLDCIDSLTLAAPVFYVVYNILFIMQ